MKDELFDYALNVVTNREIKEGEKPLTIGEAHRLAEIENKKLLKIFKRMQESLINPLDVHFENPLSQLDELGEFARGINNKK